MTPEEFRNSPELRAWVKDQRAAAPPLSEAQIERLRNIFTPTPSRQRRPGRTP